MDRYHYRGMDMIACLPSDVILSTALPLSTLVCRGRFLPSHYSNLSRPLAPRRTPAPRLAGRLRSPPLARRCMSACSASVCHPAPVAMWAHCCWPGTLHALRSRHCACTLPPPCPSTADDSSPFPPRPGPPRMQPHTTLWPAAGARSQTGRSCR